MSEAAQALAAARAALTPEALADPEVRSAFLALAAHFTPTVEAPTPGGRYLIDTADRVVGQAVLAYGRAFDVEGLEVVLELLASRGLAAMGEGVFVDVGANLGTTTIEVLLRHPGARAVAVEPAPRNLELLRQNLLLNGLTDRVVVVEAALSDTDGEVELALSGDNHGDHRVGLVDGEERATHRVPAMRLDALVDDGTIDPSAVSAVWVDAQGHEAQILAGATRLRHRPMVIEFWPHGLRRAGGLIAMHRLLSSGAWSEIVDLGREGAGPHVVAPSQIGSLAARYGDQTFTELLLIP